MGKLKNNRVILVTFAILMVIGITAAYVPLLFPQSSVSDQNQIDNSSNDAIATTTDNSYAAQLPASVNTPTTTVTSSLPDSFSGLQDEQKSLDDLNNLLK